MGPITEYTYVSKWIPLQDLNQYVYFLNVQDIFISEYVSPPAYSELFSYKLKSLKMKIMHDMYFEQIGSWDEQINTTQVRSYNILSTQQPVPIIYLFSLNEAPSIDTFGAYIPGLIELNTQNITINNEHVHEVIGNTIYINAENILISGDITVQSGYNLIIQALGSIHVSPESSLSPKIHLKIKKDFYDVPVFDYTDNSDVYNFCNNSFQYQANVAAKDLRQRITQSNETDPAFLEKDISHEKNYISLYPNPANSQITISSSSTPISEIQIIDLAGRILIHEKPGDSDLNRVLVNINSLQTGVYIVQTQCGNERSSQKLVVGK